MKQRLSRQVHSLTRHSFRWDTKASGAQGQIYGVEVTGRRCLLPQQLETMAFNASGPLRTTKQM